MPIYKEGGRYGIFETVVLGRPGVLGDAYSLLDKCRMAGVYLHSHSGKEKRRPQVSEAMVQIAFGVVMAAVLAAIGGIIVVLFHNAKDRAKAKNQNISAHDVEGAVAAKYICYPRAKTSSPVIRVTENRWEAVRKSGECELMLDIFCNDGCIFAERVSSGIFDALKVGSRMTVSYALNERTRERSCDRIKRHT